MVGKLPDFAFASEDQAACMNPTSSTDRIAISSNATSACIALYFQMNPPSLKLPEKTFLLLPSGAPILRRRMLHHLLLRFRQGILAEATVRRGTPARAQAGQEAFGRSACTTRHLVLVCSERYGAQRRGSAGTRRYYSRCARRALGRVTASFGNPRGTDGPSRGGALAERSALEEPRLRGRDRARLLDGTKAGASPALGRVTASFGNPRGTDGASGGGALAEGSVFEEPKFLRTRFFLEQRPDLNSFHLKSLHHATPPELPCPSVSARRADHFGHGPLDPVPRTSPDSASFPDALVNFLPATERTGPSQYVIPKKGKMKGKTVGQRESTQGIPPVVDDSPQEDEVVDYGDGGSDSPMDDRQVTDDAAFDNHEYTASVQTPLPARNVPHPGTS